MAKQQQKTKPTPPPSAVTIQNKDLLLRLSLMHQAAAFLHVAQPPHKQDTDYCSPQPDTIASGSGTSSHLVERAPKRRHGKGRTTRSNRLGGQPGSLSRLARSIGDGINDIAVHNKAKLDPSFKRSICKACSTILLPGTTAHVKIKRSKTHAHVIETTCSNCKLKRTIPAPPPPPPPPPPPLSTTPPLGGGDEGVATRQGDDGERTTVVEGKGKGRGYRRAKSALFSDRSGVGHIRLVSGSLVGATAEKEDI